MFVLLLFLFLRFYIIDYTTLNKLLAVFSINNICGFVTEYSLVYLEWQGVLKNELNMATDLSEL